GVAANVQQAAVLLGGLGDDVLFGGSGRSILIGGEGRDLLTGGSDGDILIGGKYSGTDADLATLLAVWAGKGSYAQRSASAASLLAGKVTDDGVADVLAGRGGRDLYLVSVLDVDFHKKHETVIQV